MRANCVQVGRTEHQSVEGWRRLRIWSQISSGRCGLEEEIGGGDVVRRWYKSTALFGLSIVRRDAATKHRGASPENLLKRFGHGLWGRNRSISRTSCTSRLGVGLIVPFRPYET